MVYFLKKKKKKKKLMHGFGTNPEHKMEGTVIK